jgi:hypothetical protein
MNKNKKGWGVVERVHGGHEDSRSGQGERQRCVAGEKRYASISRENGKAGVKLIINKKGKV